MIKHSKNMIFVVLGHLSIILAILGIPLPVLPTTPFLLLAAYCYSKGSPRLHRWLLSQKTFGPIIKDWNEYGVIRIRAKILSSILIVALFSYTLIFVKVVVVIKILVTLIGVSVLGFILSRPSNPRI